MMTSITDIQTYKRCKRKWNYQSSSRGNLTRAGHSAPALELGSLVHQALAEWTVKSDLELPATFMKFAAQRLKDVKAEYKVRIGAPMSPVELVPMNDLIILGEAMMVNYAEHWRSPLPNNFNFALPEQEFIVDIPGTEHRCECVEILPDGRAAIYSKCETCKGKGIVRHQLRGIMDGLIANMKDMHFILERKTFHPRYRPAKNHLHRTDQFKGYCWVARELGVPNMAGLAYDGMSKQAKPAKTGKYTRISDLFIRTVVQYSPDELDSWGESLAKTVNEMASMTSDMCYPNIPWNGCDDCGFIDLCDAEERKEDVETLIKLHYITRPDTRPVLKERDDSI